MNILSSGWYRDLPAVDADSSDFRFVVEYIKQQTGLGEPTLRTDPFVYPTGAPAGTQELAPAVLVFIGPSHNTATVDAVLAFYHPEVSAVDLMRAFALPLVKPAPYVKPVPPAPPPALPVKPSVLVGPAIDGIPGWFQPVPGDESPDGTVYTDSRGKFVKVVVKSLMGSSVYWRKL